MVPPARLDDIDEAVIRQLIDDQVRESRTLDYKAQLDLSDKGKQALAEDVCAFANTIGGDLVFGIECDLDDRAVPRAIQPVVVSDLDAQLLALVNSLRHSIEPRVTTALLAHPVPLAGGGYVIVLRVAASLNAPHRVIKTGQFYARTSVDKEPMDIHAIRTAFDSANSLPERAVAYRDRRIDKLCSGQASRRWMQPPIPYSSSVRHEPDQRADIVQITTHGAAVVCHVFPAAALTRRDFHTAEELLGAGTALCRATPGGYVLHAPHVNADGILCESDPDDIGDGACYAYAQVFRDASIEIVGSTCSFEEGSGPFDSLTIRPARHERLLVRSVIPAAIATLAALDVLPPACLFVSVLNVEGKQLLVDGSDGYSIDLRGAGPILGPPVLIEDFGADLVTLLRPAFDVLWNAVGFARTQTDFDAPDV
jgi:hypothetical protein